MDEKRLRIVDGFAGTGSATRAFRDAGDLVLGVELKDHVMFPPVHWRDILTLTPKKIRYMLGGDPDFMWFSPECKAFSVAGLSRGHLKKLPDGRFKPVTDTAKMGWRLALKALSLGEQMGVPFLIENPAGLMHLGPLRGVPYHAITYCQYGGDSMKRTYLFSTHFPEKWQPRPECSYGDPCHPRTPRGAKWGINGTQSLGIKGIGPASPLRSMVPISLSQDIRKALIS